MKRINSLMSMRIHKFVLLCCLSLYAHMVMGQSGTIVTNTYYFCDFEDDTENANWQLNTPRNQNSKWSHLWCIGTAAARDGLRGMYVSPDGGNTPAYGTEYGGRIVISWREFDNLDAGNYDIAFDWRNGGDSLRAALYAAWIPDESDYFSEMICATNDDVSTRKWLTDNCITFSQASDSTTMLNGVASIWAHSIGKITVKANTKYRLVFVYVVNSNAAVRNPGACVDNVQIARNNCGRPSDLQVDVVGRVVTLTWKANGEKFNIRYVRQGSTDIQELSGITQNKLILNLEHGVYTFYIQVICNGETSVWYSFPVVIVYYSPCFNYLDLHDEQCFFLDHMNAPYSDIDKELAAAKGKKIDYGFQSINSRHTIHYVEGEYDVRTYNSIDSNKKPVPPLRTIPDGEIASVRIGSWDEAKAAQIIYDFDVDTTEASVLMLKYALVLQYAGHGGTERPRFTLKVVNADTGKELSTCTSADFVSQTKGDGWYRSPVNGINGKEDPRDVCWRDWTTVGLNLTDFEGTHVRVILTAYGCTASAHYGYAYFTLNCASGRIEGINCGDTPTNEFIAPEGFNYHWYLASEPDKKLENDTARIFPVAYDDERKYEVRLTYKTNEQCGFTLSACAIPRYPIPAATYEVYQKDCKNYVRFKNDSHVRTKNLRTGEIKEYSEYALESMSWDFGNVAAPTTEIDPEIEVPAEGGTFRATLQVSVGLCDTAAYFDIDVPAVAPDSIVEKHTVCDGQPYKYEGKMYARDTVITYRGRNIYDCDSIHIFQLRFADAVIGEKYDTICHEEWYQFGDTLVNLSGDYTRTFPLPDSECDSVFVLHLTRAERPQVSLLNKNLCDGEPLVFTIEHSEWADSFRIVMPEGQEHIFAARQPDLHFEVMPAVSYPANYPLSIITYMPWCDNYTDTCTFQISLPRSIVMPLLDDVLAVTKSEYNGGFDFVSYQWYKNGVLIPGATGPNYFEEDMDLNAEYTVAVRTQDSTNLWICPFTYNQLTPVENITTSISLKNNYIRMVTAGSTLQVEVEGETSYGWYTVTGQYIGGNVVSPQNKSIIAPADKGWYLLRLRTAKESSTERIIVL